jgi:hypothetical protein
VAAGAAGAYGAYAAAAWYRYGRADPASDPRQRDALLDRFMPAYDVADRQQVRVAAPPSLTLAAARELDLRGVRVTDALFALRARVLGSRAAPIGTFARGIVPDLIAAGWALLAEEPERELVLGTVTRPWEADVTFRPIAPEAFAAFAEPGYVKIVFSLRAEPAGAAGSLLVTETRVATTDERARRLFRRYWAAFSAGIVLVRIVLLRRSRRAAERLSRT